MLLTQKSVRSHIDNNRSLSFTYVKNQEISHKELQHRSKIFARIINELGCSKNVPICCIMNKSIDFLISLMGIQYAGCSCLPIDSNLSKNRIQSIIFDSGAQWIVADRSSIPLLQSDISSFSSLNIGWMDSIEKLPDNCLPEFVRDNINYISLSPVLPNSVKTDPNLVFYGFPDNQKLKKSTFSQGEIEKFITPVLDILDLDSESKVAGLMPCNSLSIMLETMSLSVSKARLFLFDSYKTHYSELLKEMREQNITHLFIGADFLERFLEKALVKNMSCSNIQKIVLWGQIPPKHIQKLKRVFTNSIIYKIFNGLTGLCIQTNGSVSNKFAPVATIPNDA